LALASSVDDKKEEGTMDNTVRKEERHDEENATHAGIPPTRITNGSVG